MNKEIPSTLLEIAKIAKNNLFFIFVCGLWKLYVTEHFLNNYFCSHCFLLLEADTKTCSVSVSAWCVSASKCLVCECQ